jgi:hypothetical protein
MKEEEPAAFICFVWQTLDKWQAMFAFERHRAGVPKARELLTYARKQAGQPSVSDRTLVGDAANTLAELVLRDQDVAAMGSMLMFVSELTGMKYMIGECSRAHRETGPGSLVSLYEIPAVATRLGAYDFLEGYAPIVGIKKRLIAELKRGPRH